MNNAIYWLWVQRAFGYGAAIAEPVHAFGGAKALFEANEDALRDAACFGKTRSFSPSALPQILNKDLDFTTPILTRCAENGIRVLTPDDPDYPRSLLALHDYPAVLFVKGEGAFWNEMRCVALIGSREPVSFSQNAAKRIGAGLAKHGVAVISGGALGIDTLAHQGALEQGGKTALVPGCGLLYDYLPANRALRDLVAQNGALISEYPPDLKAAVGTFPRRNRIISGLSQAVVIVQAGERSGTLNTANHAKRQGRPLLVVPGEAYPTEFAGSYRLIQNGAKEVHSVADVLRFVFSTSEETVVEKPDLFSEPEPQKQVLHAPLKKQAAPAAKARLQIDLSLFSEEAATVYRLLQNGTMQLDELVLAASLSTPDVLAALTELELFGAVEKGEGNYYTCNA